MRCSDRQGSSREPFEGAVPTCSTCKSSSTGPRGRVYFTPAFCSRRLHSSPFKHPQFENVMPLKIETGTSRSKILKLK
jgi:hypothetical protein